MKRYLNAVLSVALAFALLGGVLLVAANASADSGTVVARVTSTVANKVIASDTTTYTAAWNPSLYYNADLFVKADVSGTLNATVTLQVSPDNTNWADVPTTTVQTVFTTDTVDYDSYKNIGMYNRLKIVTSGIGAGERVTITTKPYLKNDGGH